MSRLFLALCLWCLVVFSADATGLSGAAVRAWQRVATPVKSVAVGVACLATVCTHAAFATHETTKSLWLGSYLHDKAVKELTMGVSSDKQATLGGTLVLHEFINPYYEPDMMGYLSGEMVVDGEHVRFPRLRGYLIYDQSHRMPEKWRAVPLYGAITTTGYDYYDFRTDELGNDIEGFTAHHVHLTGFELPVISSSIGVGNLGFKTGNFEQADLRAWAGDNADLSYVLFHEGSLGIKIMPLRKSWDRWGTLVLGIKAKQLRTLFGDIEFEDGMNGDFTAIWEEVSADLSIELVAGEHVQWNLLGELRSYRQRLDAQSEDGSAFSSRANGKKASVQVQMLFD